MKDQLGLPTWLHLFFRWYCKSDRYEELHGDLEELFIDRVEEIGRMRALFHYAWDVLRCCQPYAWKKLEGQINSNTGMLINFYVTALRSLRRHKAYFLINLGGLSIGIASFLFISLYIVNELSYDRFHNEHEYLYRVGNHATIRGEPNISATTSSPMAQMLLDNYSEVQKATRVVREQSILVGDGEKLIVEEGVLFTDSTFFDIFNHQVLQGDIKRALVNPRSLVLTRSYAKKYFGDSNPIGKALTINEEKEAYLVSAIVEDPPVNSHIQFNILGSILSRKEWNSDRWIGTGQYCYIRLKPETIVSDFEERIRVIFYDHMASEIEYYTGLKISEWEGAGNRVDFKLVPVSDIHLKSEADRELQAGGNITYIYIYGLIALMSLFIAIFNFVNLATAHAATRGKEVGVRKVIGSSRRLIVYQFVFESILVTLLATVVAVILVQLTKGSFFELIGKPLAYDLISHWAIPVFLIGLALIIGVFSGFYPAFVLSAFKPIKVLKGTATGSTGGGWFRNLLVTFQFICSIVIIIGAGVVYGQLDHMLSKDLGFDQEQVLVIEQPAWLGDDFRNFREELLTQANVQQVSKSETVPGKNYEIRSYRRKDDPETFLFLNNQIQHQHLETLGLELASGRFFSKDFPSDSNAVVINETAARKLGFSDPVGKPLTSAFKKDRPLRIIGVVRNYHVQSLHQDMAPMSLELSEYDDSRYISVRLESGVQATATIAQIDGIWRKYANHKPLQCFFLNQDLQNLYKTESSTGRILLVFSGLTIFIACMGLIGLMTYVTSARQKEIGIRKVLGAGLGRLVQLLSIGVIRLVVFSSLIAWPLAYWATGYWLDNFAERIDLNFWNYLGATGGVFLFVALAIIRQVLKAVQGNPVDSLRDE